MNPSTRQSSYSRRSSILKLPKQSLTGNGNGSSNESSPNIKLRRRVSFAEKKHVKEFCNSLEQGTVWNNTYEEHDSSNSKASNLSNEAQGELKNCNQENQVVSGNQLLRNSTDDRGYNQEYNNDDDGMDLTESIGVSLATVNHTNINYRDSKTFGQEVCTPQLILAEYNSNVPNASTCEEMPIEFTEVVRPLSIHPRNYTSVCQYIHARPSQGSINTLPIKDVDGTSRMNTNEIDDNSIEFTTPILSTITAAKLESQLDKENIIPQYSTCQDIPMEFTAPITVLRGRVNPDLNQEETPLLSKKLLQQVLNEPNFKEAADTLVFDDSSMDITKAVSVKPFPTTCESENDTKMESSKTQIWCNDDMQMTTVIKDRCFVSSSESLKARLHLQEKEEPIAVLDDKTTIFQDNSMMITTAISPACFGLANNATLLGATNLESNLVEEAPQDKECSMQLENQSIEITKAVGTHGILSSYCMPNTENCCTDVSNRMSIAREPSNKSCGEYEDVSMEITRAVNTQRNTFNAWNLADKENYPMENENPVNIIRKSSRKSLANAPIRKSIVPDLLLDKENYPTILQNLPSNERNMFPDRIAYPESNNILNQEDYVLQKETPMDSSEKITLDGSMRTDNTRCSDMSMELTSVTHIPTCLSKRNYIACDASRNISETIPGQNLECNDNRMILVEDEKDCVSTCAYETGNTTTTDLNISNQERNPMSNENPENKTICPQDVTSTASGTNQSCVLNESEFENPEEEEDILETCELSFHNLDEDLHSIKPPSFEFIEDMECNGEDINNVSINDCSWNKEEVTKNLSVQITSLAEPPTDSSINNDNENKVELSSIYQDYTDAGYYQENNAVRACYSDAFASDDLRRSQAFPTVRKSLGMTSIFIDNEETKQAIDDEAFHQACADNSIANSINCSSILLDRTDDLMVTSNKSADVDVLVPFETSASVINDSKNDSYMSITSSVHLNRNSNAEVRNRLEEISHEISVLEESSKKCVTINQYNSTENVEIVKTPTADSNAVEEDELGEKDPFSFLVARLKHMVKNDHVIWDVFHVNVEQRKIVIGYISCSLLVSIVLEDTSVDFVYYQFKRLRVVSRLKREASDILMRIAHRLLLEQINTEAHLCSYKEHHNIFQLIEDITADVKLVLDFIIDLKRLNNWNLMTISDEQITFKLFTRRVQIILKVTMDIKVFSKLEPADIHIECLLGTINEEDVRNLIKNVKRNHKFLRRYIEDVKDYIYIMEN